VDRRRVADASIELGPDRRARGCSERRHRVVVEIAARHRPVLTPRARRKRIMVPGMAYTQGELLLRAGVVTPEAQRRALAMRARDGGSLGECLVRLGVIDEERLATFYHKRLVLPLLPEASLGQVAPEVLSMVPAEVASEFRLLPVALDRDGALLVAMADPSDNHAVEELAFFVDRFILRAVATESAVRRAFERHYKLRLTTQIESALTDQISAPLVPAAEPDPFPEITVEAPRPAFIPTTVSPALTAKPASPAASDGRPLFPANQEPRYDPIGRSTAVGKRPAEEVVLLTRKKRTDETPLPPPAPPPIEHDLSPTGARVAVEVEPEQPHLLTRRRQRERTATLPGVSPDVPPPPLQELRGASARDQVARLLLEYAAQVLGRAALFVVRNGALCGYDARGGGLERASVEVLQVALTQDSLFREVTRARLPYRGPLSPTPLNRTIARALGTAEGADVLALPILVRDRVVALLFGDSLSLTLPEAALQALCYEAGLAYERILRQGRANAGDPAR
jgi:hypothetical protein